VAWLLSAVALFVAAAIVPGVSIDGFWGAVLATAVIAVLNAVLPPVLAALRLPFTLVLGLLLVLVLDAAMFMLASDIVPNSISVDSFWWALVAAFVASAVSVVLDPLFRTNDDETYALRVTQRIARRSGGQERTDVPGIVFLEIDGLALPVLRRAVRDGNAPEMARWLAAGDYVLTEWETDLSSQTGASQAGILLGSNEDIPAFRWIEKETGRTVTCSNPGDCAEIEQRHSSGVGLLRGGGASRGNLLSGEAEHVILTVSRLNEEKRANPGYRVFFANGFNVTRVLVLFAWEVLLEWTAALRSARRDVLPRGHRGGKYPFMRAAMCVVVRDLIVFGVLSDMMKGRPVVYATFSSYDEVAHHSGLERADTLEALRKLDQQFGRIARARRYAPRPYRLVVLSDHGQTQGATFLQRNGYGLADLVNRSLSEGTAAAASATDENDAMIGHAVKEATGGAAANGNDGKDGVPEHAVAVLGSGNLGLVYLLEEPRRLTLEEIEERHPRLIPALREHPHVGFVLVRSAAHGAVALGGRGAHFLDEGRVEGEDPLAPFSPNAPHHLRRTDAFPHVADIMVNSFYDQQLDEGCAFEELISFHGGLGGPQTRPFILHPGALPVPEEPIVGAAGVHDVLLGWREALQNGASAKTALEAAAASETGAATHSA
ncbi:MAG TPA: phage holin family protein, partial [Gaiellaceae bacterium]|nr:phage holin family protein [Gaiellaceae bacterium]